MPSYRYCDFAALMNTQIHLHTTSKAIVLMQVEDVMTSCDERLQIAPRATCAEERKQGHSWIFG